MNIQLPDSIKIKVVDEINFTFAALLLLLLQGFLTIYSNSLSKSGKNSQKQHVKNLPI